MNIIALLIASLVPLVVGFVWYNPKVFGKAWIAAAGVDEEKMKGASMPIIFGVTFLLSFILAFAMQFMAIHQFHVTSLFYKLPITDPSTEAGALYKAVMDMLGSSYRTFKHGSLHGTIGGFTMAMPVLAINALFERKGFKYIAINAGYWMVAMGIMGGIVSALV